MKMMFVTVLLAMTLVSAHSQIRQWPFHLAFMPPGFTFSPRPIFPNLCAMMIEGIDTNTSVQVITQIDDEGRHTFNVTGEDFIECVKTSGDPGVCRMFNLFNSEFFDCLEQRANGTQPGNNGTASDNRTNTGETTEKATDANQDSGSASDATESSGAETTTSTEAASTAGAEANDDAANNEKNSDIDVTADGDSTTTTAATTTTQSSNNSTS